MWRELRGALSLPFCPCCGEPEHWLPLDRLCEDCLEELGRAGFLPQELGAGRGRLELRASEGEKAPRKKPRSRARTNPYIRWSELLRRSFGIDIFTCPHCNGRRRILAFLEDPVVTSRAQ